MLKWNPVVMDGLTREDMISKMVEMGIDRKRLVAIRSMDSLAVTFSIATRRYNEENK